MNTKVLHQNDDVYFMLKNKSFFVSTKCLRFLDPRGGSLSLTHVVVLVDFFCFTAYSFHRNFLKLGIYM